jgi:multicomponent K+:H+ antiporter subunit E
MTLAVFVAWLVLNQSLAVGHLLLGAAFAVVLGRLFARLDPPPLRIRNRRLLVILFVRVLVDIARSNLAVLSTILSRRARTVRSGFVEIPLELTSPYGLAVLACIITSTPGTIWMSYRSGDGVLLIHIFDLTDEATAVRAIREDYAGPLKEIFE